jgi:hypothetical protein
MYGNPHKRESFLGPMGSRRMGRDRDKKQIFGPGKPFPSGTQPIFGPGKPFPSGQETIYRPLTAGYDGGNTRPRGPDGRPLPFNQYPSRNVPVPIMDYTGSMTASMDPGSKYNGTYKQEGYGDPRFDDFGQEEYYDNRDYYMDDVIDPGLSGYDRGPLYFS